MEKIEMAIEEIQRLIRHYYRSMSSTETKKHLVKQALLRFQEKQKMNISLDMICPGDLGKYMDNYKKFVSDIIWDIHWERMGVTENDETFVREFEEYLDEFDYDVAMKEFAEMDEYRRIENENKK